MDDSNSKRPFTLAEKEELLKYKSEFERQRNLSVDRKERLERLMMRKSMMKKSPAKKQQMIRRHLNAVSEIESTDKLLEQLDSRINNVTNE